MQIYPNLVTESLCIVVAFACIRDTRHSIFKWTLPYLLVVFFFDYYSCCYHVGNNIPFQYIISLTETAFYTYIFYHLYHNRILKRMTLFLGVLCLVMLFFGLIVYPYSASFYVFWLSFDCIFFSFTSLLYLCERFMRDDVHLNSRPGFWLALGVLMFFSGSTLAFMMHDFIVRERLMFFGILLYQLVPQVLSVFLYLFIAISLILHKTANKHNNRAQPAGENPERHAR